MKVSTLIPRASGAILLALALGVTARATDILSVTSMLTTADSTQLGRLSRNGIQQDWLGDEPFPGIINSTTTYHYRAYTIDAATIAKGPFIQIDFDAPSANLFVSAYFTSYNPDSAAGPNFGFDSTWLGDAGASGNLFGVDPRSFQVVVPTGDSLVVVVNNTAGGNGGVGDPFGLLVESFSDTAFSPANVPDAGASVILLGLGLAGVALVRQAANKRAWSLRPSA